MEALGGRSSTGIPVVAPVSTVTPVAISLARLFVSLVVHLLSPGGIHRRDCIAESEC
jgi:hypothetical protein